MEFEIDVSGSEIFSKDYTIVIADRNGLIIGYKFNEQTIQVLKSRYGEGKYRFGKTKQQKALFRVRIYCIAIHYLFKSIIKEITNKDLMLHICRDFPGHEKDINTFLIDLLKDKLGLKFEARYVRLPIGSNADKYAYLMRKDKKNLIKGYIKITINDFEEFLIKK